MVPRKKGGMESNRVRQVRRARRFKIHLPAPGGPALNDFGMRKAAHTGSPARRSRRIAVVGMVCLLLQLAWCSPLLPLATALAAWIDGGHSVVFVAGAADTRLELRHDAQPLAALSPQSPTHQHGTVIRALMVFAEPASSSDPDHVIAFAAAEFATSTSRSAWLRIREGSELRPRQSFLSAASTGFAIHSFGTRVFRPRVPDRPPDPGVALSRSVVLLI